MYKYLFIGLLWCGISVSASAQYLEAGLFGGVSNYNGDLSTERINVDEIHPAIGGFLRYNVSNRISLRLSFNYGKVSEADNDSDIDYIVVRNLSFRSNIYEVAFIPEFNIMPYGKKSGSFTPYVFAGIAGFHFNPQAYYQGEWVDLQPLGTEGQGTSAYPAREKYNLFSFAIPFGAGLKFRFSDLNIGLEAGIRKTFTDYLDDVSTTYVDPAVLMPENGTLALALSNRTGEILGDPLPLGNGDQRGNPATTDWYAFTGVTISFNLGRATPEKGGLSCPKF